MTTPPVPVAFQWSGGKDSAHALGRLLRDERYEVRSLVTTVDGATGDSTVHQLPATLLQAQAAAIGLPLDLVPLAGEGLGDYAAVMGEVAHRLRQEGVRAVAFGDLEHSGAVDHREALFAPAGLAVIEPLHGMTSPQCLQDFLRSHIEAITVVVDASVLDRSHLGVRLDDAFVASLPDGCDPCGEYGEYHTLVINAPYFRSPVPFTVLDHERIERRIGTTDGVQTFAYWQLRVG